MSNKITVAMADLMSDEELRNQDISDIVVSPQAVLVRFMNLQNMELQFVKTNWKAPKSTGPVEPSITEIEPYLPKLKDGESHPEGFEGHPMTLVVSPEGRMKLSAKKGRMILDVLDQVGLIKFREMVSHEQKFGLETKEVSEA